MAEVVDCGREEGVSLATLVSGSMEDEGAGRLWLFEGYWDDTGVSEAWRQ